MSVLLDRLYAWRDRLIASPRFQRGAARFLLTRPIAERQAAAVFDLCAGFVYAQILRAAVELRLLERLISAPTTANALAKDCGLSEAAALRLLHATTALGLTAKRSGARYGLGLKGAALLGNPGALRMIEHHHLLYADLADPVRLLRGEAGRTKLQDFWGYSTSEDPTKNEKIGEYSHLMAASLSLLVEDLLSAYPFQSHQLMMDIGGGSGEFIRCVSVQVPDLRFQLFDLPNVCDLATPRLAEAGLATRVEMVPGDARIGPMPQAADLVTLIRVLHDHDDAEAQSILESAFSALVPGGTLIIAEPMSGQRGTAAMADAYFGFYFLAMGSGRTRTPDEIRIMLERAGFEAVRPLSMPRPILASALVARRAAKKIVDH